MSVIRRLRSDLDAADPLERRVRRFGWLLAGSFSVLGVLVLLRLWTLERAVDVVILGALALLRNSSPGVALEVGERIRDAVARIDLRDIGVGAVTVSVGASISRSGGEAVATLVERADHALYRAKRNGRNRVEAA